MNSLSLILFVIFLLNRSKLCMLFSDIRWNKINLIHLFAKGSFLVSFYWIIDRGNFKCYSHVAFDLKAWLRKKTRLMTLYTLNINIELVKFMTCTFDSWKFAIVFFILWSIPSLKLMKGWGSGYYRGWKFGHLKEKNNLKFDNCQ